MADPYAATNPLSDINELLATDLTAVNERLIATLSSHVPTMEAIIRHLISCGGKRIRPKLLLLTGLATGAKPGHPTLQELAVIVECIHTATLLHDDVVDESDERRGQPTANLRWGNPASVLAGDFLYSRAFQALIHLGDLPIMRILAETTNQLTEGELLQLLASQESTYHESTYFQVIEAKTAALFRASCRIGAMIGTDNSKQHDAFADFGYHLGMAFQITDDLLDYTGDPAVTGKPQGADLAQGKVTLPLIYALNCLPEDENKQLLNTLKNRHTPETTRIILDLIKQTDAIKKTLDTAKRHGDLAEKAIAQQHDSQAKHHLLALLRFSCQRDH